MGSGGPYFVRKTINFERKVLPKTLLLTDSGYRKTGGVGAALCSCGWVSEDLPSRDRRRLAWEKHYEEENPWYEGDEKRMRNERIKALALDRLDEINSLDEIKESPVFMTKTEKQLFDELEPKVILDLVARYRKQR